MRTQATLNVMDYSLFGTAIDGLSAKQVALALSTQNLSQAQLEEIVIKNDLLAKYGAEELIKTGLLSANSSLLASEKAVSAEKLQEAIIENALNKEKGEEVASTAILNKALMDEMVKRGILSEEKANEILQSFGIVSGDVAETASKSALTKATWELVKAQAAQIATSPVGMIALAIGAGLGLMAIYDGLTTSLSEAQENLEDSMTAFNETTDEINSLNEELKTTEERIKELQKLSDSGTISVADEAELETLKEQNKELARQIALKQRQQITEGKEALEDAKEVSTKTIKSEYEFVVQSHKEGTTTGADVSVEKELQLAMDAYDEYKKLLKDDNLSEEQRSVYEDLLNDAESRVDEMYNILSAERQAYLDLDEAGYSLDNESKERLKDLNEIDDTYLLWNHTLTQTKQSFESLNAEQQRSILLNRLLKQGLSKTEANSIIDAIPDDNLSEYWDKDFSFILPTENLKKDIESELKKLEKGGSVNLTLRPQIDTSELNAKGWDAGEGTATVFSSTYSNEDGTVAVNFTPIIADPKTGKYLGTLSPEELQEYAEGVIAGTKEDDLNLQIGSAFKGEDAIQQAEESAVKVHELHEKYFSNDDTIDIKKYGKEYAEAWLNGVQVTIDTNKVDTTFESVFNSEDFAESQEALLELAKAGTISPEVLTSTEEYKNLLKETGLSAEEATKEIIKMCGELDYTDLMSGLSDSIGVLIGAEKEMEENGVIAFSTVQKMLELYPELEDALIATSEGYTLTTDAIEEQINAQTSHYELIYNEAIEAANKLMKSQFGVAGSYAATTEEIRKQINAQMETIRATQTILSRQATKYRNDGTRSGYERAQQLDKEVSSLQDQFTALYTSLVNIDKAQVNLDKYKEIVEQLRVDKTNSSSSKEDNTDYWKEEFDTLLSDLKHRLEMNQITEAQYYNTLEQLNKKYFANRAEYLEEYRQYEEEVYKGLLSVQQDAYDAINNLIDLRIDMIKDLKEKEIKAHEETLEAEKEKLEAINKQIDARKEAIELMKDEKSHSEEMSEKNKSISDIQAQIDNLSMDNSASAQKKRRELQEQLTEAQKELADYISDYEYDKAMEALDKEAEIAEEKYDVFEEEINEKIEVIEKFLDDEKSLLEQATNDINNMNNTLFTDMKNWAMETTGEIQNIIDAWGEAQKAIELYKGVSKDALGANNSANKVIANTAGTVSTTVTSTGSSSAKPTTTVNNTSSKTPTSSPSSSSSNNSTAQSTRYHTVQSINDTLWNLAVKYYGDGTQWTKIQKANGNIDPKSLKIGQKLIIPYKKGTKNNPYDTLAWVDELGEEIILRANESGRLDYLTKGTSVIPANISKNLIEWGKMSPTAFKFNTPDYSNVLKSVNNSESNVVNIGDIIIQGNAGNLTKADLNGFRQDIVSDIYASLQKNRVKSGRY